MKEEYEEQTLEKVAKLMQNELLKARYEVNTTIPGENSNGVVWETALKHKSVRQFKPDALPNSTLPKLIAAAQSAATSSNLQTYSVIAVQNPAFKSEIALLCGDQEFIRAAPLFLVFCADLSRLAEVSKAEGTAGAGLDYAEMFLMACIDASLAAQNVALAAEASGLGICYVGAARNKPLELAKALKLPKRVFAVFGMAIGIPADEGVAAVKPRLPQAEILHLETYSTENRAERIAEYDAVMQEAYAAQGRAGIGTWSHHSAKRVASPESLGGRHTLFQSLQELGFPFKDSE